VGTTLLSIGGELPSPELEASTPSARSSIEFPHCPLSSNWLGSVIYYLCVAVPLIGLLAGAWAVSGDVLLAVRSKSIIEQAQLVEGRYNAHDVNVSVLCQSLVIRF
jgi:hypothetical protein